MTVADGGLLNRAPAFGRSQPTARGAGKARLRRRTEPQVVVHLPERLRLHFQRDLGSADVGRLGDDLAYRDHAEVVRVADRSVADREFSGSRLHQRVRTHDTEIQRLGNRKGLHGGTGLERIGEHAVADVFHAHETAGVGVVRRPVAHRKNFAGTHVHHNNGAGLGLMAFDGILKRLMRDELQTRIDREHHVGTDFTLLHPNVFNNTAESVANNAARALLAGKDFVVGKLHPLSAVVVRVGKAHDVRRNRTVGVIAAHFVVDVNAGQLQRTYRLPLFNFNLTVNVDEALVLAGLKALANGGAGLIQKSSQLVELSVRQLQRFFGLSPDAARRNGGSQNHAVAIENLTALCGHGKRAGIARLSLLLQEVRRDAALQPKRLAEHGNQADKEETENDLAARGGNFSAQQRLFAAVGAALLGRRIFAPESENGRTNALKECRRRHLRTSMCSLSSTCGSTSNKTVLVTSAAIKPISPARRETAAGSAAFERSSANWLESSANFLAMSLARSISTKSRRTRYCVVTKAPALRIKTIAETSATTKRKRSEINAKVCERVIGALPCVCRRPLRARSREPQCAAPYAKRHCGHADWLRTLRLRA